MNVDVATKVCFIGMVKGLFTGKGLSNYLNDTKTDFVNARRIINGTDRAKLIASYAVKFYNFLEFEDQPKENDNIENPDSELVQAEAENPITVEDENGIAHQGIAII